MKCIQANIDITIIEGGTFDSIYQWKTGTPAVVVDLTGYSAEMQIRAKLKNETSLLTIPFQSIPWVADGLTGIYLPIDDDEYDESNIGKYRIYIKDNDTLGLCEVHKNIVGVYDLFLYNSLGESVLKQYGVATIQASVTRNE